MDIAKSHRLVKFSNTIKDFVNYMEIKDYLMQCQIISSTDHEDFCTRVEQCGNAATMEDLIHLISLRRGGYNAFIGALRDNNYNWIADKIEPNETNTKSSETQGIFTTIAHKFAKQKPLVDDRTSFETTFTSYRKSMPMDLGATANTAVRPNSIACSREIPSAAAKFLGYSAKSLAASMDTLQLHDYKTSQLSNSQTASNVDEQASLTLSDGIAAIIYNIPEFKDSQYPPPSDVKIITKIAGELKFPQEYLTDLKVVRVGRVSKDTTGRPLKVKFRSVKARNAFVSTFKEQSSILENFGLAQVKVVPCGKIGSIGQCNGVKKVGRWYHNSFLSGRKSSNKK